MDETLLWAVGLTAVLIAALFLLWAVRGRLTARLPGGVQPIFTNHARRRMTERGITSQQVTAVLRAPQLVKLDVAQNSVILQREISGRTLKVMVAETWPPKSSPIIKTTAWRDPSTTVRIPASHCGRVIGTGGRTIRGIEHRSGARISVKRDGAVRITADDWDSVEAARRAIETITSRT